MSTSKSSSGLARRSFLSRIGAGAAAFGTAFVAGDAAAQGQAAPAAGGRPDPARHAIDDWFDQPASAKHRLFFDTTTPDGFGHAVFWANNFFNASRNGYNLTDADQAIVIGVRHRSSVFALSDAMWQKYGEALAGRAEFSDPKTKQAPTANVFLAKDYGASLTNSGVLISAVTDRGLRLSVCALATRANASAIASRTGGKVDDIYKELCDHLVPNSVIVPAGIIALNRAQERGYSFTYAD